MRVYPILLIREDSLVKVHPSGPRFNLSFLYKGEGCKEEVLYTVVSRSQSTALPSVLQEAWNQECKALLTPKGALAVVSEHTALLLIKKKSPASFPLEVSIQFQVCYELQWYIHSFKNELGHPRALHTLKCKTEEFLVVRFIPISETNRFWFSHLA